MRMPLQQTAAFERGKMIICHVPATRPVLPKQLTKRPAHPSAKSPGKLRAGWHSGRIGGFNGRCWTAQQATGSDQAREAAATRPIDVCEDDCPEASTSSRCGKERKEEESLLEDDLLMRYAVAAAVFENLKLKDIQKKLKEIRDRVYFGSGEYLPIVGTMRMSYGRLLQLLRDKRVKRIYVMGDGRTAIVEVPFETHASDYKSDIKYDRRDLSVVYVDQKPEWQMEKMRYYCELPGDIWADGSFMKLIKRNQYHHSEHNRMKYEWMLKEHEVTTELVVLDPNDAYVFLNNYIGQLLPIAGLFFLRGAVGVGDWLVKKFGKKKKDPMAELAEQYGRPRAVEFNVGEGAARNDTGVRFEDVAGIDAVKDEIIEVIKMMRGAQEFEAIGARAPRGILLEGPPGTGKTYLAKAIAGEGGMPFYSCNGAEFVEMFSGVAAARIRNMFKMARKKAPAVIFIDEIDAIGKRRGAGGGDTGSAERESGLMQLLVELDGIHQQDQVLVIAATNRLTLLDPALLRPGRFDRLVYMGRPAESNRLKILQVHAKNKSIPRGGDDVYGDDALLREAARLTLGYSGADLANLLNEAAILSVREANVVEGKDQPIITMTHILEAMEKTRVGLPQKQLPDSKAKKVLATMQAGRAVALSLVPGIPEIESLSIRPQGNVIGRILFRPREYGREGDMWHSMSYPGGESNLAKLEKPLNTFELCSGLLVPLYAGRVTEEVMFGKDSITLSGARDVSRAGDLAYYLVAQSNLHPAFRHTPMHLTMRMGGFEDPTLQDVDTWFERHTAHLQDVAYKRAQRLIEQRKPVIAKIAELLCTRENETVTGGEILDMLSTTPLAESAVPEFDFDSAWSSSLAVDADAAANGHGNGNGNGHANGNGNGAQPESETLFQGQQGCLGFNSGIGNVGAAGFKRPVVIEKDLDAFNVPLDDVRAAAEVVVGNVDVTELLTSDIAQSQFDQIKFAVQSKEELVRVKSVRKYSTSLDAEFPQPPAVDGEEGSRWKNPRKVVQADPEEMEKDLAYWRSVPFHNEEM